MGWWRETRLIWKLLIVKEDRYQAACDLAEIGSARAVRALVKACNDASASENNPLFLACLRDYIGNVTNAKSLPVLIRALQNTTSCSEARVGAALAVAEIRDPRAIPPLYRVLDDEDVAEAAAKALKGLGQALPPGKKILRRNIHVCAEDGDTWNVERLLARDRTLIGSRDFMSRTPLHRAARGGRVSVIRLLLQKGADINARDEYCWTPLHMAAETNKPEALSFLLARGARVEATDSDLRTALHRAAEHNSADAIIVLCEKAGGSLIPATDDIGKTARRIAADMGHKAAIEAIGQYE